jgi:hypothetical protein
VEQVCMAVRKEWADANHDIGPEEHARVMGR